MTRFCILLLLLACTISSAIPGGARREEAETAPVDPFGNDLRIDVADPMQSLHPVEGLNSGSTAVFPFLYDYLFTPVSIDNFDDPVEPFLAHSWSYDTENSTWIIQLRNDAVFHNGIPVTAADVRCSLVQVFENRPGFHAVVRDIRTAGDNAVEIALNYDDPEFLSKVRNMALEIFPCPGAEPIDYYNAPVGSGPYKFVSRTGERQVVLEANERYKLARPSFDKIILTWESEPERTWSRLIQGKADVVTRMDPGDYRIIRERTDRYHFSITPSPMYSILLFNTRDPLFADPDVRRALGLSVNRSAVLREVLRGYGVPCGGPMLPESDSTEPDTGPLFNPRKALELFHKCGWVEDGEGYLRKDGKLLEFQVLIPEGNLLLRRITQHLLLILNEIGVRIRIEAVPPVELTRRYIRNTEFQAVLTNIMAVPSQVPERLVDIWGASGNGPAVVGCFEDSGLNSLLHRAASEKDPERRKELFRQAEERIVSLQPGSFLYYDSVVNGVSKRLNISRRFSCDLAGFFGLRNATVNKDWPKRPRRWN